MIKALLIFTFMTLSVNAQDLNNIKIRNLDTKKTSVYFTEGIFHHRTDKVKTKLKKIRQNYTAQRGYERLVFDFTTNDIPNVYGHIDSKNKRITFDILNTDVSKKINAFGKNKYVEKVGFYPVSKDTVSVEINLNQSVKTEVFYLKNPGKLVFDFTTL